MTDYAENSLALHKEAIVLDFVAIAADYEIAKKCAAKMESSCIASANACRSVGIRLQTLCGHEQISFEFWVKNNCADKLPFGFEAAKQFVSIARKLPDEVKTIEEAAPFTQLYFFALNLLEAPARDEQQKAISVSVIQKFIGQLTTIRQLYSKSIRQCPVHQWSDTLIDDVLNDSAWYKHEIIKIEAEREERQKKKL